MVNVLHVVPGLDETGNGISVAARLMASEQSATICEARTFDESKLSGIDEVWVHSMWTPMVLRSCRITLKGRKRLVRMIHANLDPVRLEYHAWKKRLVGPIERHYLRRSDRIVATCEAERGWIETFLGKSCPQIEVIDLKRFFNICRKERKAGVECFNAEAQRRRGVESVDVGCEESVERGGVHLLYLGRRHPLKGLEYLEAALEKCKNVKMWKRENVETANDDEVGIAFRIESSVFGEEKERVWEWCDVLVLPPLSENFGLVVAEALERGKYVLTTDGAPAWNPELETCRVEKAIQKSEVRSPKSNNAEILQGYGEQLFYLKGYRDGSREMRVSLLREGLKEIACLFQRGKMV